MITKEKPSVVQSLWHFILIYSKELRILTILFFFAMKIACEICNPDTDAYFLIENGRYLIRHGAVPVTNPWVSDAEFGIVLQQWGCSVANYVWYFLFGMDRLWILAILMHVILLSSFWKFASIFTDRMDTKLAVLALVSFVVAYGGYLTTRPYQITMALSVTEIAILWEYRVKMESCFSIKEKNKLFGYLAAYLGLIALMQANWQISFFVMVLIWPLCFFTPDFRELVWAVKMHKPVKNFFYKVGESVGIIGFLWGVASCCGLANPYGMEGLLYLFRSSEAMRNMSSSISELIKPSILSLTGILVLITVSVVSIFWKQLSAPALYLGLGTVVLSCLAVRNTWFLFPFMIAIFATLRDRFSKPPVWKFSNRMDEVAAFLSLFVFICVLSVCTLSFSNQKALSNGYHKEAVEYLSSECGGDAKIYTTFNTGAMMEFAGYSIYIDARPELFTSAITGKENRLAEWISLRNGETDLLEFLQKGGYTHAEVDSGSRDDILLTCSLDWREITRNDNFVLYETNQYTIGGK